VFLWALDVTPMSAHGFRLSLLLLLFACSPSPETSALTVAVPAAAAAVPHAPPPSAECLDKADLADGAGDRTVHRCANCALVMEGDQKFSSTIAEYTFHSCSGTCKSALEANPGGVLARACLHK
jgi:hypothetical protein